MIWYIPTWSGDYRLTKHPERDDECLLTIEKPTENEKDILLRFFDSMRDRGWTTGTMPRLTKRTFVEMEIGASLYEAGPLLLETVHHQKPELWTGVKSESGKISLLSEPPGLIRKAMGTAATALATVTAPSVGCPAPEPCNVRASEVLRAFSTPFQFEMFERRGYMPLTGNVTGERYWLFHRNEAARKRLDHALLHESGETMCVWHAALPAEEEMLAIKFLVEHREERMLDKHITLVNRTNNVPTTLE